MKRYNIKCDPGPLPEKGDRRIQIREAPNGEWVRYEDALALISCPECGSPDPNDLHAGNCSKAKSI